MELPIAESRRVVTADALVRAVRRAAGVLRRTITDEQPIVGGVTFSHADRLALPDCHMVSDLHVPANTTAAAVLAAIEAHESATGLPNHLFDTADGTWDPTLREGLLTRGATVEPRAVLRLTQLQPVAGVDADLQIIPARAAYRLMHELAAAVGIGHAGEANASDFAAMCVDLLDEPRLELLLARRNSRVVGCAGVLTLGDTGVIQLRFTHPDRPDAAVSPTLLHHLLEFCRRSQFEHVLADGPQNSSALHELKAIGFTEAATCERLIRPSDRSAIL